MNDFSKQIKNHDIYYEKLLKKVEPIRTDYLKVYNKLNKQQKESLQYYKGFGYKLINELLFKNDINSIDLYTEKIDNLYNILKKKYDEIINHIYNIENSINKYNLKNKITVYKGIYGEYLKIFDKLKVNDTINIKSFLSTSFNPQIAFRFTNFDKKKKKILIEINLPKNTNILYLQYNNKNEYLISSEFEILINRGAVLKLNKISTIEEKFFNLQDLNWKKYLNTKKKVKKIYVYHMSLTNFNNIELPLFNNIINNINLNKFIDNIILNKLYYIPNSKINKNINFSNLLGG